jgi:ThiF family
MSLPRFLDRVLDSTVPALGAISRDAVREKLRDTAIMLRTGREDGGDATEAGFLLAANLLARLYPVIHLDGPEQLVERARNEVTLTNPLVELPDSVPAGAFVLAFNSPSRDATDVVVSASGWSVLVDALPGDTRAATVPAALAAAAIGAGELFRTVFAVELGARGRHRRQPGTINLITLGSAEHPVCDTRAPELGEFALVGAGAIGQAAAQTLALSGARGTMLVVDHESVTLSNLQRYVLARDSDVQAVKVDLLQSRLSKSEIDIVPIHARWHAALADRQRPTLVALDSAEDRMAVQAALPGAIYNAWTQPADVGWSRHEHFGKDPCLACLYLPAQRTPNLHEQIAVAFQQHPLRVLAYLARGLPVGLPLPPDGIPNALPGIPLPADAQLWAEKPLLVDIAAAAGVEASVLAGWEGRGLTDLYRDGVCGGALLHLGVGAAPSEVLVPLAHQSALAGVMLATQLIIARTPQLIAQRSSAVEGRYDVLAGLPQVLARPRARSAGCICGDSVYRDVYAEKSGDFQPPGGAGGRRKTERSVPHG